MQEKLPTVAIKGISTKSIVLNHLQFTEQSFSSIKHRGFLNNEPIFRRLVCSHESMVGLTCFNSMASAV